MSQKKRSKVFPLLFFSLLLFASSCGQQQKQEHESEKELSWEDDRLRFVREIGRMNLSQIPGIILTDEEKDDWFRMHEIIPTADEMCDTTFFQMLQLEEMPMVRDAVVKGDFETARIEFKEFFQEKPVQKQLLDIFFARKVDSMQVIEKAQQDLKEKDFGKKDRYYQAFTTWGMMNNLFLAYCLDGDPEYLVGCFRLFNFFYHELRPPAGTPDVYVSVNGTIDPWRTLMAASRLENLITIKQVIDETSNIHISSENYLNLNKSIFELQDFLVRMNQKFYNSNWQVHQMTMLLQSTVAFPELKNSSRIAQMAWQSLLCHMERETLADGGYNELATSYSLAVINIYKHALIYARLAGLEVPDEFLDGLHSMYNWLASIADRVLGLSPAGDAGIYPPGSLVDYLIEGALLFRDPEIKWFIEDKTDHIQTRARYLYGENFETELTAFESVHSRKPNYTSVLLRESGYGIMRSSWEPESNYMMLDFGSNEPWHAQADFLSINVYAFGQPVITNSGSCRYDSYRSRIWYKQTVSHNTLWVNGMSQEKSHDSELENWVTTPHFDFISASHPGYLFLGVKPRRNILFVKGDPDAGIPEYWLVSDDLLRSDFTQTTGYFDARWLAHFQPTELDVTPDQRVATTTKTLT